MLSESGVIALGRSDGIGVAVAVEGAVESSVLVGEGTPITRVDGSQGALVEVGTGVDVIGSSVGGAEVDGREKVALPEGTGAVGPRVGRLSVGAEVTVGSAVVVGGTGMVLLPVGPSVGTTEGLVVVVSEDGRPVVGGRGVVVFVPASVELLIGGNDSMVLVGGGGAVVVSETPVDGPGVMVGSRTVVGSATEVEVCVDSVEESTVTVGRIVVGSTVVGRVVEGSVVVGSLLVGRAVVGRAVVGWTVTDSVELGVRAVEASDKALLTTDEMPASGSFDEVGVTSPVGAIRMPLVLEESVTVGVAVAEDETTTPELVVGVTTLSGRPPVDEATLEGSDDDVGV